MHKAPPEILKPERVFDVLRTGIGLVLRNNPISIEHVENSFQRHLMYVNVLYIHVKG